MAGLRTPSWSSREQALRAKSHRAEVAMTTGIVMCLILFATVAAQAQSPSVPPPAPVIPLPDVLAVEMPKGVTQIGPGDSPLRELLTSAHSATRTVTSDLR